MENKNAVTILVKLVAIDSWLSNHSYPRYSKSLTWKPNKACNFTGVKSPSLVVDFQEGLNGGRWNVTGTILWLSGWVGVLGFLSQLPFFFFSFKKKLPNPCQQSNQYWTVLFFAGYWGLINHLLLHHLFLSSSFHLSHFLPLLHLHLCLHYLRCCLLGSSLKIFCQIKLSTFMLWIFF